MHLERGKNLFLSISNYSEAKTIRKMYRFKCKPKYSELKLFLCRLFIQREFDMDFIDVCLFVVFACKIPSNWLILRAYFNNIIFSKDSIAHNYMQQNLLNKNRISSWMKGKLKQIFRQTGQ